MRTQFGRKNRDDHLPSIDLHDLGTKRQNRVREILLHGEGRNPFEVLRELYEEADVGGPPPYLAVRPEDEDENRSAMIVIRCSRPKDEVSTEIEATKTKTADYADPYDSPEATAKLSAYAEELLFRLHAKLDTPTVRFSTPIRKYLEAIEPGGAKADKEEQARLAADLQPFGPAHRQAPQADADGARAPGLGLRRRLHHRGGRDAHRPHR